MEAVLTPRFQSYDTILDSGLENCESINFLFHVTKFGILCCNTHKKLIQAVIQPSLDLIGSDKESLNFQSFQEDN